MWRSRWTTTPVDASHRGMRARSVDAARRRRGVASVLAMMFLVHLRLAGRGDGRRRAGQPAHRRLVAQGLAGDERGGDRARRSPRAASRPRSRGASSSCRASSTTTFAEELWLGTSTAGERRRAAIRSATRRRRRRPAASSQAIRDAHLADDARASSSSPATRPCRS